MPTIAVVEDNEDNRLLVRTMLDEDYEICEYETGSDALTGLMAQPPDLVLLDISLPGMDGTEVLAKLRADPHLAGVPVIALTAHAMTGDREKYLSQGFDDYVTKPITEEQLLFDSIEKLLNRTSPPS